MASLTSSSSEDSSSLLSSSLLLSSFAAGAGACSGIVRGSSEHANVPLTSCLYLYLTRIPRNYTYSGNFSPESRPQITAAAALPPSLSGRTFCRYSAEH